MSEPPLDIPAAVPPPLPSAAQPVLELPSDQQFGRDDYHSYRHQPGIITAIGVISIVVGSLGILGGGVSALYGGLFYVMSRSMATATAAATTTSITAIPQGSAVVSDQAPVDVDAPPTVEDRGLDVAPRQVIIDALATQRPLNDSRKRQLHALLAKCGQDAFANRGNGISAEDVHRAVSESGQLPSDSDTDPNQGPDYFVIAAGRIEVRNDQALFEPTDKSEEKVRVSAALPGLPVVSPPVASTSTLAQQAVAVADFQTSNRLTAQQKQSLNAEFASGSGMIVSSPGAPIATQLRSVTIQPDGSALVLTPQGQIRVNANGSVQSRLIYFNNGGFGNLGKVSGGAATLVITESVLSILLAIYLLVIGILTLRQSGRGRGLHFIYAALKIPLAIAASIGWWWFIRSFFATVVQGNAGNSMAGMQIFVLALTGGVAVIYPVSLLIALSMPSVRYYYNSSQG